MTKVTLETEDGDYVTSAEVADPMPALIIWNGRYFVCDLTGPVGEPTICVEEPEPLMLPYEMPQAKPAGEEDA